MKISSNCLITGEPVDVYNPPDGGRRYEYVSKNLGHIEWTELAFRAGQYLTEEEKYIIAGVCRNNKEKGIQPTQIAIADLQNCKSLNIPYSFEERCRWFLQYLYDKTGKDFRSISFNTWSDCGLTYSGPDEFKRIVKFLASEELIEWESEIKSKPSNFYQDVRITKKGKEALRRPKISLNDLQSQVQTKGLEDEVNDLEINLRQLIFSVLTAKKGNVGWDTLITGDVKSSIRGKIKEHVRAHPGAQISDFDALEKAMQFTEISHLQKIICNPNLWIHFELIFQDQQSVNRYFQEYAALRNTIKHHRELTDMIEAQGKVAMLWLNKVITAYSNQYK